MKYGDLPGDWMNERYQIPLILVSMGKQGSMTYYKGCMVEAAPFLQENTIETAMVLFDAWVIPLFSFCSVNKFVWHTANSEMEPVSGTEKPA